MLQQMRRPWPPPFATSTSFLLPLFLLISVLVPLLPPSSCDEEPAGSEYNQCDKTPLSCGSRTINVSYPFKDDETKPYCGHRYFELRCNSQNTSVVIEIQGQWYQVKDDIDYDQHNLTLVYQYSDGKSCSKPNSDNYFGPFFIPHSDQAVEVTIWECFYPVDRLLSLQCSSGAATSHMYFWPNNSIPTDIPGLRDNCPTAWHVWMDKSAIEQMKARNISYEGALLMGFNVNWTPEDWPCSNNTSHGILDDCIYRNPTVPPPPHRVVEAAAAAAAAILLIFAVLVFFYLQNKNKSGRSTFAVLVFFYLQNKNKSGRSTRNIKDFLNDHGSLAPKAYKYSDLKKITKSFHNKLGQGGYGSVYRGQLRDGRAVAVKILDKSRESGAEFINEITSIGRTSHVNIVSLLGFCHDGRRRALVYEFMPNGSLDKYIYSDEPKALIPWDKLYQIAIGIAHGLEYLHRGCSTRIVHFDIKPHNILLDEDFHPKISDFGLAKLCPNRESKLSVADTRGTIGFIAPEVFSRYFGEVSTKSDVYSYGMMVLEMVGGRRNVKACDRTSEVYFPHWVYEHLDRHEDMQAFHVEPETVGIARRMTIVGLWSVQTVPANRPSMSRVVEMLEGNAGDLEMPAKPFICSPVRSLPDPRVQSTVDSSS